MIIKDRGQERDIRAEWAENITETPKKKFCKKCREWYYDKDHICFGKNF